MAFVYGLFFVLLLFVCCESKPASVPREDNQLPAVVCKLPPVRGHCRALLIRWRYDPVAKKCQEFKFGGCDGNANNFQSQKSCMNFCAGI